MTMLIRRHGDSGSNIVDQSQQRNDEREDANSRSPVSNWVLSPLPEILREHKMLRSEMELTVGMRYTQAFDVVR